MRPYIDQDMQQPGPPLLPSGFRRRGGPAACDSRAHTAAPNSSGRLCAAWRAVSIQRCGDGQAFSMNECRNSPHASMPHMSATLTLLVKRILNQRYGQFSGVDHCFA
jgi:hypothetical protein